MRRRGAEVVWFDFEAICGGPRSASDYVEVARDFHTVFVSAVSKLTRVKLNADGTGSVLGSTPDFGAGATGGRR